MTRSGRVAAAAAAIVGNGQDLGSLQACVGSPASRRQPVSPNITMRCGLARGSGNGLPSSMAATAPAGTATSQPRTANCAGLTLPNLADGSDRMVMGTAVPSKTTDGDDASAAIAPALEFPSVPSSTHCERILASTRCGAASANRPQAATPTMPNARQ